MRWLMIFSVLLLCAPLQVARAQQGLAKTPIFRYISIEPYGKIRLGEPFAQRDALGKLVAPQTFELRDPDGKRTTFGDTQAIRIVVDSTNRVRAMIFQYLAFKDFEAAKAEYLASLGPASSRIVKDSANAVLERLSWHDGATGFTLATLKRPRAPDYAWSELHDVLTKPATR